MPVLLKTGAFSPCIILYFVLLYQSPRSFERKKLRFGPTTESNLNGGGGGGGRGVWVICNICLRTKKKPKSCL